MLTGIRLPLEAILSQESSQQTPRNLLLACHERIRHFTAMARRLAENPAAPLEQVADAADAIHRYFSVALPLHEADENVSIDPRLQAAGSPETAQASEEMVLQHRRLNAVIKQLLPLWDALCREPEKLPGFVPRLVQLVSELESLWEKHLRLEEEIVFPAMERMPPRELEAILREMRERRGLQAHQRSAG
jgi:hemerythrin-like domain-containing protein